MLERTVTVDFSHTLGRLPPVSSALGGPLFLPDLSLDFSPEYSEMNIPFIRLSDTLPLDTQSPIDVSTIFADPGLDPAFELSYDFNLADRLVLSAHNTGAGIFLRLGESPDPYFRTPRLPTMPPLKWAKVAEKIILHYNKGFAGGFKLGIKYIEIWPGADRPEYWGGTAEEFYSFYSTVATYLKSKLPSIKIGGYSVGGFMSLNDFGTSKREKDYIPFLEGFLKYIGSRDIKAPLDFLTWECPALSTDELTLHASYARSYLMGTGHKKAASVISRFSLRPHDEPQYLERTYPAALICSLILAEKCGVDMMFYDSLDPRSDKCSLWSLEDRHNKHYYSAYHALSAYGRLVALGTAVQTTDDFRHEVYSLAATDGESGAIIIVTDNYAGALTIELSGAGFTSYSIRGMLGGGSRGVGYAKESENIPLKAPRITLKVGKGEIYLITLK